MNRNISYRFSYNITRWLMYLTTIFMLQLLNNVCVADNNGQLKHISDTLKGLLFRVEAIEKQLYDLKEQVNGGNAREPINPQSINSHNPNKQNVTEKIRGAETYVSDIEPNTDILPVQNNTKNANAKQLLPSNDFVADANVPATENSIKQNKDNIVDDEKNDYDNALIALKNNNLPEAEKMFEQFITQYPLSKYHGNAIFWYAETFFHRGMLNEAALNYLKSYKKHPKGIKAHDALLKLALSLHGLDSTEESCNILDKLDKEFKDRPASSIRKTKEARVKFNCK